MEDNEDKIFSVSEYIDILNSELKKYRVKVIGEVGKVDIWQSGHVYFSLRDEKDKSVINCVMWRSKYGLFGIKLKEGDKIIAEGYSDIYKQTGKLSFIAETIELAGEGRLKKEYEELKKKLEREGIFAKERKRAIPMYVQKIGIITSKQGAVLADFLSNIGSYGFKIKMIDSRVEGQSAIADLLSAVRTFREKDIEVLVVMRGGGSFESLQPFNNELLVREIADFPVPVIAAIGHEKDVPLVSLAADLEVSTPSIAAIALGKSWKEAAMVLEKHERNIFDDFEKNMEKIKHIIDNSIELVKNSSDFIVKRYKKIENNFIISVQKFKNSLLNIRDDLEGFRRGALCGFAELIKRAYKQLEEYNGIVFAHNPERQLSLGYGIASINGKIVKSVKDAALGDNIDLMVVDGTIASEVKNIKKTNKK